MQTLLNTLYLTLAGYLHLDNDTLRFEIEKETQLRVPLHHIGSVVCFGDVLVSPAVMGRLAEEGKALVLLDRNGRFKARLEGPISGNILLRRAQFAQADSFEFVLAHAKACIAGKLKNSRYVLLRGARDANEESDAECLARPPMPWQSICGIWRPRLRSMWCAVLKGNQLGVTLRRFPI